MSDFEEQLKKFKNKLKSQARPSLSWKRSSRKQILSVIRQTSRSNVEHFSMPVKRSWFARRARVVSSVLVFALVLGSGTTLVAQGAEPGDVLYPVKIASEDVSVLVTIPAGARARLYMKYVNRRINELESLYEKGSNAKLEEIIERRIDRQMSATADSLTKLDIDEKSELLLKFEEITRMRQDRIRAIRDRVPTSTVNMLERQLINNEKHRKRVIEELERIQQHKDDLNERYRKIQERVNSRLELIKKRRAKLKNKKNKLDKKNQLDKSLKIQQTNPSGRDKPKPALNNTGAGKNKTTGYVDDDGVYRFILDEGGTNIDINIRVNSTDGGGDKSDTPPQVNILHDSKNGTTQTTIRAKSEGGSVNIDSYSSITSSSSRRIIINGKEVEVE